MSLWNSTFKNTGKPMQRSPWKKRTPKKRAGHNKSYLSACRGQQCWLQIPGVCMGPLGAATVVPAHSNQQRHGKGMGLKADDRYTVPACMSCHAWIDQGPADKQTKFAAWDRGYARWAAYRDRSAA